MDLKIYGPEQHGNRWRLDVRRPDGTRTHPHFATESEALDEKARALRAWEQQQGGSVVTVAKGIERYEAALKRKGNKPGSIATTLARLRAFFGPDREISFRAVTESRCRRLYEARFAAVKVDTHRNELAEARTFLRWAKGERLITGDPLGKIKGDGKRRKGKEQLRIDEARKWIGEAVRLAEKGDAGSAGAVAAMMTVIMGMRASEITTRVARDLDDGGRLLWIPDSKTKAGKRTLEVPEVLRPLLGRMAVGKQPTDPLFPADSSRIRTAGVATHWRDWPRENVQRICKAVGVPKVTAHGMRGLHSTLAREAGVTAHVVAASLGHEKATTTEQHYIAPGTSEKATARAAMKVLDGGRRTPWGNSGRDPSPRADPERKRRR